MMALSYNSGTFLKATHGKPVRFGNASSVRSVYASNMIKGWRTFKELLPIPIIDLAL